MEPFLGSVSSLSWRSQTQVILICLPSFSCFALSTPPPPSFQKCNFMSDLWTNKPTKEKLSSREVERLEILFGQRGGKDSPPLRSPGRRPACPPAHGHTPGFLLCGVYQDEVLLHERFHHSFFPFNGTRNFSGAGGPEARRSWRQGSGLLLPAASGWLLGQLGS